MSYNSVPAPSVLSHDLSSLVHSPLSVLDRFVLKYSAIGDPCIPRDFNGSDKDFSLALITKGARISASNEVRKFDRFITKYNK